MRYFHRSSISLDDALALADDHFGRSLATTASDAHERRYAGSIGEVAVQVEAEGGHYTLITVTTDQVGESEADTLAKRFLTLAHQRAEPRHVPRGAY